MSGSDRYEVVVIGGGAIGTSVARAVAEEHGDVALLEKRSIASGSSGLAAGIFRRAFGTTATARLAADSVPVFEELEAESMGIGLHRPGYAILASEALSEGLERAAENAERFGATVDRLDRDGCLEHVPGLVDETVDAGIYVPGDGYADPHLFTTEQASFAKDAGVDIFEDTPVTGLQIDNGAVRAVRTDDRRIEADVVVNAAGAWSKRIAAFADISLPIRPVRIFALTTPTGLPSGHPMVLSLDRSIYYRDEPGGGSLVGGPVSDEPADPERYSSTVDADVLLALGDRIEAVDSRYEDMSIESSWAGLKTVTPDGLPIVGRHGELDNVITATGFNGHGFMLSPGVGELVADIVADRDFESANDLSPERFTGRDDPSMDTEIHLN